MEKGVRDTIQALFAKVEIANKACHRSCGAELSHLVAPGTFFLPSYGNFTGHYQVLTASSTPDFDTN